VTQLIYSFDNTNLPASQGASAGSIWDNLTDLDGIWGTTASKSIYQIGDSTAITNGWLETPSGGNAPNGQSWNPVGMALILQWDPSIVSTIAVILHSTHDGASPPTSGSREGYVFQINPNVDGVNGSLYIYRVKGTISSNLMAQNFTRITGKMQLYCAVQAIDSTHSSLYGDIRAAATPGNISIKRAYPFFGGTGEATAALQSSSGNTFRMSVVGGFRNVGNPSSYIDFFKVYSYDGVISNDSQNNASATNLPVLGSDLQVPSASMTLGTLTRTSVSFSGTGGKGSSVPITSQWTEGSVGTAATALPNIGSPVTDNAGSGVATTLNLTGLAPGTFYAVGLKSTDSFSGTGGPLTTYTTEVVFRTWLNADLAWLFLGDSIYANAITFTDTTNGNNTALSRTLADEVAYQMEALLDRRVLYSNSAVAGLATADWLPGAGSGAYNAAIANYNALIASNGYTGPKWASLMLGANDALFGVSAAAYGANLQAICNALVSGGITNVVVHYPSPFVDGGNGQRMTPAMQGLALAYQPQVDALPSALEGGVSCGDRSLSTQGEILMRSGVMQRDGLHPFSGGLATYARAHALANALAVAPPGSYFES
jgi:lysophospholipase L1-like esterase